MPKKKQARALSRRAAKPRATRKAASDDRTPAAADRAKPTTKPTIKATIRQLRRELAQAREQIEQLQASADMDFLLGIFNRRGFERELNRVIAYIQRYHASAALIVLDVDRLKPINDVFGHAAGDTRQVRASDAVGRLGGDEFGLLLWNLSKTDAKAKAAVLEAAIDQLSFEFEGQTVRAGASAGVAILDVQAEARRALEEADRAMYVRKAQRRHEERVASA
jgi:diguanylate cyclase (GGDEF)-like protein